MISTSTIFTALLLSTITHVQALNDWSAPCHSGQCSFDVPRTDNALPGSLNIWGKDSAISDLTEAGGWIIMGCNENPMTQPIRAVCKSTDAQAVGCDHITQNGADGTVVRLPPGCGKAAFAVVKDWGVAEDQSIDPETAKQIDTTPNHGLPQVHKLTIDSQFGDYSSSVHGVVNFAIAGGSIDDPTTIGAPGVRRSRGTTTGRDLHSRFDVSKSKTFAPIDVSKSFTLASGNVNCDGPITPVALSVGADVTAHADISMTVAAAGHIFPPKITSLSLSANMGGSIESNVTFTASASGAPVDITKELFSDGIPGFDFPGIFELGPTFNVNGRVTLDLAGEVDIKVGVNYKFDNVAFTFPPSDATRPVGTPTPQDSNLDLSLSPNITVQSSLSAHLIPQVSFGLKAFLGKAQATVNFGVDTYATAAVNASLGAIVSTDIPTRRADASVDLNACVDISSGINAEVTANADFFSVFKKDASLSVFSKKFDLFSKCFDTGSSTSSRKRALPAAFRTPTLGARDDDSASLTCPPSAAAPAEPAVSGLAIPADSIQATS